MLIFLGCWYPEWVWQCLEPVPEWSPHISEGGGDPTFRFTTEGNSPDAGSIFVTQASNRQGICKCRTILHYKHSTAAFDNSKSM